MNNTELRARVISDTAVFWERAAPFLMQREVEHNLMLGLCAQLINGDAQYTEPPFHCVVETAAGQVVAAALRTPPYPLILSHIEDERALSALAMACLQAEQDLSGALGKPQAAGNFAEAWRAASGQQFKFKMRQMLHRLDAVIHPDQPPAGRMRAATLADASLLEYWYIAFQSEAFGREGGDWFSQNARHGLRERLTTQPPLHYLWYDGIRPRCWVGYRPTTERVARVAPVYTPPSERGRGYASALVAAVSQDLLDRGYRHCSLYTDLANPTSNAIYRRVGYEPICEIHQYERGEP